MLEDIAYVLAEVYAGVSNLMWGAHCAAVTAEKFTPSASVHYCLRLEWQLTSPSRCTEPRWTCYAGHGYIMAVGYVGVSILLCGLFVRPSQLRIRPLLWLSYLSYPRYDLISSCLFTFTYVLIANGQWACHALRSQ